VAFPREWTYMDVAVDGKSPLADLKVSLKSAGRFSSRVCPCVCLC
jgi:hypothetical protein